MSLVLLMSMEPRFLGTGDSDASLILDLCTPGTKKDVGTLDDINTKQILIVVSFS